ncbi:MAG: hypothetical protein IT377_22285 [Polyangiaceae bacterium]|nr:hypothetical protein [Polyangiaceae bacterium]
MRAKRIAFLALALALVAAAIALWPRPAPRPPGPPIAAQTPTEVRAERPRRPRATRPRPPAPEIREAAVSPQAPQAQAPVPTRVEQLATTVLAAAVRHDWMVIDEQETPCPPQQIRIVYDAPSDLGGYTKGAYFEPLGPGPTESATEVNGLMLCEGSSFLYRGFEAYYRADRGQWDVFPFPVIE